MAGFPSWEEYRPPDAGELARMAREFPDLPEAEVSDPASPIDNRTAVRVYLFRRGVRGTLFDRLVEPYDLGFYLRSDGKSTPIPALRLRPEQAAWGFCRDIVSVRHDLDYYRGIPGRAVADHWYHVGQRQLGERKWLAAGEYLGLRVLGWAAWNTHAESRRRIPGYGSDVFIRSMPRLDCGRQHVHAH